ncbi:haloacid dehalogenase-like hydrolase [Candidatus Woesearchaeota archaeon]|nr:haloacid dehalogenase-like hydrolase [Candidatus Woesearchaeota archaeon]
MAKAKNIIIRDKNKLEKKIRQMKKGGTELLHVISDFDKTLTRVTSKKAGASTSYDPLERDIGSEEFIRKAKEMLKYYYPIEISPLLQMGYKKRKMDEWWEKYFELAVKHGMSKAIIQQAIDKYNLYLRRGARELFSSLKKNNIPFLVFSAGVGNLIEKHLKDKGLLSANVHIVSNFFIFNKKGAAVGYSRPLVHVFNKNEGLIRISAYKKQIKKRKNVILLGDSLGDLTMADGMKHECIVKIGFYNHKHDKQRMSKYKKGYDVIITGNKDMLYVNKMLKEIIKA